MGGLTKEEIVNAINEARKDVQKAEATVAGLQAQYVRIVECDMHIAYAHNPEIMVDFKEGKEKCIYEGFKTTGWATWILLHHFTKRGKLCKKAVRYEWDIARSFSCCD